MYLNRVSNSISKIGRICSTAEAGACKNGYLSMRNAAVLLLGVFLPAATCLGADVLTWGNDNARTGQNLAETQLTPQNVNQSSFGKLFTLAVDGQVYAQPLFKSQVNIPNQGAHDVLFVATEHDSVYALDATGNNPAQGYLWKRSFIDPNSGVTTLTAADVSTGDITPEIGITGTPVIDASTNTIYFVAKTKEIANGNTTIVQRLHALDLGTGDEKMNGPIIIKAAVAGNGAGSVNGQLAFDSLTSNNRAGLLLMNGTVYIAWAAHGDMGNYHGWVMGYSANNVQNQTGAFATSPNGIGGGIWMSGGALSGEANGNIYTAAGNGTFGTGQTNYGDSAVTLSTANGLQLTDYFTPENQDVLNAVDNDMGVSNALLLPDQPGVYPHLLVTADKSGVVYILNREALGSYSPTTNDIVEQTYIGSTIHNSVTYFNGTVYVGGDGNRLRAYTLKDGLFQGAVASQSSNTFGQNTANGSGSTAMISANGNNNAIAWALQNFSYGHGAAVLYAYDANNLGTTLYSSDQAGGRDQAANAVKFTVPTVVNGKVYVPGTSAVTVYGLLNNNSAQVTAPPVFNPAPGTVFGQNGQVSISDATPGAAIYVTTDGSNPDTSSPTYSGPISITGPTTIKAFAIAPGATATSVISAFYTSQASGLSPAPSYGSGFTSAAGLSLNNGAVLNGTRLRLTDGGKQEAGTAFYTSPVNVQRFTTEFEFQLSNPNADGMTFTIQGVGPTALGAPGGGLGYGPDPGYHVSASERSIPQSVAVKFDLFSNNGEGQNSTGLYTNGTSPTGNAIDLSYSGIDLHNGSIFRAALVYDASVLTLTLTDTADPTKTITTTFNVDIPGAVGGPTAYVGFTAGTGDLSATQEILQWSYNPVPYYPSGFAGSRAVVVNGGASIQGPNLQLTDNGGYERRSAFYNSVVNIKQFTSDFQFQLSQPGTDGFAFVLQNVGPNALGAAGGALGYGNDSGGANPGNGIGQSVALKFDLFDNNGEGTNSIGVYTNGAYPSTPATDIGASGLNLHSSDVFAAHLVYDGLALNVTLQDITTSGPVFTASFPVNIAQAVGGNYAYAGFTGGTGLLTGTQNITSFTYRTPAVF